MLEHIFGSMTRVRLLLIFFRSPGRAFYVRELARLADNQLNGIRREIANLEKIGLVRQVEPGEASSGELGTERSKYYQLCADSLLFQELKALLIKAQLLEDQALVESLRQRGGSIKLLILTGVFTGATDVETDLVLVGQLRPLVIANIIREYETDLGKSIRYTLLTEAEFKERQEIGDKFLYSIFESHHLTPVDVLERH